jgi:hypothetical protein
MFIRLLSAFLCAELNLWNLKSNLTIRSIKRVDYIKELGGNLK